MKMSVFNLRSFFILLIVCCQIQCKKSADKINIQLYDQPLSIIQKYITGRWKLEYTEGGGLNNRLPDVSDTYMTLDSSHITIKNKNGYFVDTTITWQKVAYGSATTYTYLMKYSDRNYPVPFVYAVQRIQDDMLVLRDRFTSEDSYLYFSKSN